MKNKIALALSVLVIGSIQFAVAVDTGFPGEETVPAAGSSVSPLTKGFAPSLVDKCSGCEGKS
jgi:hypothetical protein